MRFLSVKEQDLCTYTGIFGCLLTAACTLQHFIYYKVFDFILPAVMLFVYLLTLVSFILFALQKWYAPVLLLISAVLGMLNAVMSLAGPLFSPIVLLHFVYTATLVIVIYIDQLPGRLRQRELTLRAEREEWENIL